VHESEWSERVCEKQEWLFSSLTHTCEHDIITILTILTSAVYIRAEEAHTHTHTHTHTHGLRDHHEGFDHRLLCASAAVLFFSGAGTHTHTHTHSVVIVMTVS